MKKALLVFLFLLFYKSVAFCQSIDTHWANVYKLGISSYYKAHTQNIKSIKVKELGFYASGKTYQNTFEFNFTNPKQVQGRLFKGKKLTSKFLYELDDQGRNVRNIIEYKTPLIGWQKSIYEFEYQNNNKVIERHYNGKGQLLRTVNFEYDSHHHPTKMFITNAFDEKTMFATATYDYPNKKYVYKAFKINGKKVLEQTRACNVDKSINQRNGYGDYVKVIIPNANNNAYHILKYKYDKQGNWVKRRKYYKGKGSKELTSIIKRKIIYK